jgi:hypothetical protein
MTNQVYAKPLSYQQGLRYKGYIEKTATAP